MNNQQPKPDPKGKAIASFVLGIVSVALFAMWLLNLLGMSLLTIPEILFDILVRLFWGTPILGLIGLYLGKTGLKSSRRHFAIIGIILCIISLLVFGIFLIWGLYFISRTISH